MLDSAQSCFCYWSSGIGKKQLMAVTGLVWCGFVLMHMAGNLLILVGPEAYNVYGHAIVSNPLILPAEALLVLSLLVHIGSGLSVTFKNRSARTQKYAMTPSGDKAARFQSKFMIFHGSILLVYIILHLASFKYGPHYVTQAKGGEVRDLYKLVIELFHQPIYVVWYCIALVLLGFHLSHGFYSSFASLGIFHPKHSKTLDIVGRIYAVVVVVGFVVQPLYVFFMT